MNGYFNTALDWLKVLPQYLIPHVALSSLAYRITRSPRLKGPLIRAFCRLYRLPPEDPRRFPHFNAFFTRPFGERPIDGDPEAIVSPVDGTLSALGEGGPIQAKGQPYALEALLGGARRAAPFQGGAFATLYLSPRDYHRVHMPLEGRLKEVLYIPGRLFAVNPASARRIPGLFTRNERLVLFFEGPMALVMVGAILVGGLETVPTGAVTPPHGQPMKSWRLDMPFAKGQEVGRFNMGSTVVLLFPRGGAQWEAREGTRVRVGERIGRLAPSRRQGQAKAAPGPG